MKVISLLVVTLLAACGTDNQPAASSSASSPLSAPVAATTVREVAPADKAAPVEPRHSLAVADTDALPACDDEAEGWLVYVKAEAVLKACIGGEWSIVDVRAAVAAQPAAVLEAPVAEKGDAPGAKGDQGAPGAKGDQGAQGVAGVAGAKGDQGERGRDGAPGLGDVWTNPEDGTHWLIAAEGVLAADAVCPAGMAFPALGWPQKFLDRFGQYLSTVDGYYWAAASDHSFYAKVLDLNDTARRLVICTGP